MIVIAQTTSKLRLRPTSRPNDNRANAIDYQVLTRLRCNLAKLCRWPRIRWLWGEK